MSSVNSISQKEYLKKYLSGEVKKKNKKKITGSTIKRSVIVDDDIDLKSMRPLEDDEVELYQMDEDAPLIAGIVDERPAEMKAQEYYSSKRWKVFGGEDGVNVVDSMNKNQDNSNKALKKLNDVDSADEERNSLQNSKFNETNLYKAILDKDITEKKKVSSRGNDFDLPPSIDKKLSSGHRKHLSDSDESQLRDKMGKPSHNKGVSNVSPLRKHIKNSNSDSDVSPPRRKYRGKHKYSHNDSDESPPRRDSRKDSPQNVNQYRGKKREDNRYRNNSHSPPRRNKQNNNRSDSDNSPPRRGKHCNKLEQSSLDTSYLHKSNKYKKYAANSPPRRDKHTNEHRKSDSDASPPRKTDKYPNKDKSYSRGRTASFSDSDSSPPRRDKKKSLKPEINRRRSSRSRTPPGKHGLYKSNKSHRDESSRLRRGNTDRTDIKHSNDFSPPQRRQRSKGSDSDLSPPRENLHKPLKKSLYKPNADSSSDEGPSSKIKKMKTTLDGKQAGLQDAKLLKKELLDIKSKEDAMFSKMDASVSGVGAAPVKRDRKTGQIRDLEKEKETQREKKAKESVVNEKYYKWGKGLKQTEDAALRAAEIMKEMNKPLARYVDDNDLDEFLKAQEREGDPMLEYIKRKQSESTPLQGEKPIYKGSWNHNRFNIRPGYRWDGVVRSNGYEQEWFKTKNAKKARDEEAYKWSTSDM